MAFFRTGGGGIPAALKSAMNAVLNKKFGTAQTYEPNVWPDDVNLLGVLEEKTASGAIAHIEDGADGVPLKHWLVTLPASLSGYSEVNGVQTKKNLIKPDKYQTAGNNLALGQTEGTSFGTFLKAGTYTISYETTGETCYIYRREENDASNTNMGKRLSTNFTLESDGNFRFWLYGDGAISANISNVQIEVGSTATAYEAYTAPTQYTASLGRTIYGGTADIVSGQGTDGYGYIVFDGSNDENWGGYSAYNGYYINISDMKSGTRQDGVCNQLTCSKSTAQGQTNAFWLGAGNSRLYIIGVYDSMGNTLEVFRNYLAENPLILVYPLATSEDFTFEPITPTPETALGVNNFWADEGDSDVTYRSSGTVTPVPVVPTLISKTITENGTYDASDDNADGYSEVTVNVQGGATPFVPQFTETKIADNSSHAASFTLSEDYGNYDMVKIVWYESATVSGFLYTTPDILDEIFSVGVGKLCINKPSTNYYVCYTKSGLTWTQSNQRNISVLEIYGVTFTNCTMTATDLYKRGTSTTDKHAVTSQTSLKDYDLFMMASIHATDGSETMPTTWLYQYPPENMGDAFSCPVPTVLQEYNANDEAFVISEYGMTAARYFMVQGIKFTAVSSSRGLMMASRPVTQLVGEESDPDQVNELVENDETEQEGEDDA